MAPQDLPKPWISTPLIESSALSRAAGCRIFLKLENLQPAGSFKSRGIGNLVRRAVLAEHDSQPKTHFYSSSGGNAGLACATAARLLDRPSTVVLPLTANPLMKAKIRIAGASEVIQHGASWVEADRFLRESVLAKDPNGVYVPPFEHRDVWDGAATIIEELEDKPDAVICSVGGGGLFNGLQLGLERRGWEDVNLIAMEAFGADSLARSLEEEKLITLNEITSIATSLGAKTVSEKTFELAQRKNVKNLVLSDAEAAMGCWRLADDERLMVEPACGVNVALCYNGKLLRLLPHLRRESKVVIILCGGSNITLEGLCDMRKMFGDVEKTTTHVKDIPSTISAPHGVLNGTDSKRP